MTTERAGHAHDRMESASEDELNALDGVVVVVCYYYSFQEVDIRSSGTAASQST